MHLGTKTRDGRTSGDSSVVRFRSHAFDSLGRGCGHFRKEMFR